jgi:hypothetical protein
LANSTMEKIDSICNTRVSSILVERCLFRSTILDCSHELCGRNDFCSADVQSLPLPYQFHEIKPLYTCDRFLYKSGVGKAHFSLFTSFRLIRSFDRPTVFPGLYYSVFRNALLTSYSPFLANKVKHIISGADALRLD